MSKEEAQEAMHAAADVVVQKLKRFLTPVAIDGLDDCRDVLLAAQDWLPEDDADVAKLRQAIVKFNWE